MFRTLKVIPMKFSTLLLIFAFIPFFVSCTTPLYMKKVKLLSYSKNPHRGKSLGRVSGKDCSWRVFQFNLGAADLERAIAKSKTGSTDLRQGNLAVDYFKNLSCRTKTENYFIVSNTCYVVTGTGYRN